MSSKTIAYQNAQSFRQALETRLANLSKEKNLDLERLRKEVAFDRFLARIFHEPISSKWLLKGGYAMELRFFEKARATKDIDLTCSHPSIGRTAGQDQITAQIREELQDLALRDVKDWFEYLIKAPVMDLQGAPYGGARFPVEVRLAGRRFTNFALDVGVGDVVLFVPEWREDHHFLDFAGIPSVKIPMISKEQQFAEKIHAYTLPREGSANSRTKDLIDLVLLIESGLDDKDKVREALKQTFGRRKTHELPTELLPPPRSWQRPYEALARDCGVVKKTLDDAFLFVTGFWKRILTRSERS